MNKAHKNLTMKRRQPGMYVRSKRVRESEKEYKDADFIPYPEDPEVNTDENLVTISQTDLKIMLDKRVNKAVKSILFEVSSENFPRKIINTAKLVPEFDPENRDMNVKSWIRKIDQLGEIYQWSDEMKSFNLQSKLLGQARAWYNRLESYDHTWEEWKTMLLKAFPRYQDYATLLDEMMSRRKMSNETMTKYFQEKLALCYRCQLSDEAAVSCIIRGLPSELQTNAQAFQCDNPDELYEGFLSAFDNYQTTPVARAALTKPGNSTRVDVASGVKDSGLRKPPVCFRCNETGHVAPTCKQPDNRKCFRCGKIGHVASSCMTMQGERQWTTKKVQILSNLSDTYKKTAKINKLRDLYSGPYIVKTVLNNGRYEISSIKGMRGYKKFTGIVPADALRPYRSAPNCGDTSSDEEIVTRDDLIDLLES